MGAEFELKFAADEEVFEKILADHPHAVSIEMATTYYDTPCGRLSKKRYTLRKRLENGVAVCTVKTSLKDFGRGEWEVNEQEITRAIGRLCQAGAPEDLLRLTRDGVLPICGARFTRRAALIEKESFSAELALDRGVLTGGGKEMPLCEAELEYKSGNMEDFLDFANTFAKTYRLRSEPLSKFRRALNLHLGEK